MLPKPLSGLEKTIGYSFKNKKIITEALTHSSYANENRARKVYVPCNERLEFLGDSVLSIIVSEHLYSKYKSLPEGELTKLRASLVQSSALAGYAQKIGLGDYLYLGNGEEKNDGRHRQSLLENAFEALLAAVRGAVRKSISMRLRALPKRAREPLQSLLQAEVSTISPLKRSPQIITPIQVMHRAASAIALPSITIP